MRKITFSLFLILAAQIISAQNSNLNQSFELRKAKEVKLLVSITGGVLNIGGETDKLADVDFKYDEKDWTPAISYTEDENYGKLLVKTTNTTKEKNVDTENICNIKLNKKPTYSVGVSLGAGVGKVNLENYSLSKALFRLGVGSFKINLKNTSVPFLKVDAGIGEATFDLSGKWKNNLKAEINAGIGEVTFIVPQTENVTFVISGFLGSVDADGFKKDGNTYTNHNNKDNGNSLEFNITGAIGNITIIQN